MAAGVPVVATQVGGLVDFIFDAKRNPDKPTTAWAVDRDNPEQIAEAVRDILDSPEKAREVAKTARDYVLRHYDWDDIAHRMQNEVFARVDLTF
jgi:phosphatidylinositol alpha-1,6-mannosyltransferase